MLHAQGKAITKNINFLCLPLILRLVHDLISIYCTMQERTRDKLYYYLSKHMTCVLWLKLHIFKPTIMSDYQKTGLLRPAYRSFVCCVRLITPLNTLYKNFTLIIFTNDIYWSVSTISIGVSYRSQRSNASTYQYFTKRLPVYVFLLLFTTQICIRKFWHNTTLSMCK